MKATVDLKLPTVNIRGFDVPVIPNIHQRIYKAATRTVRSLYMGWWHGKYPVTTGRTKHAECGTTHCRAGWAIHLAGKQGYDLEDKTDPGYAGTLLYQAAGYFGRTNFGSSNAEAKRDMKRLAKIEYKAAAAKLKQQRAELSALRP